jgi:hypothetical protein
VTYQLNFAGNERVAVHVPGRPDCLLQHVRDAGTRSRFYRRKRPDGSEIDDVEAMLGVVEGIAGPVLKDVAEGAPLTDERKGVLAQFLAVQMLRGPAFFAQRHVDVERFVPKTLTRADLKPALLARVGGDLKLARQQVVEMFQDSTQGLMSMVRVSMKVSAVLGSMRWRLLRFDEPVVERVGGTGAQQYRAYPGRMTATRHPAQTAEFAALTASAADLNGNLVTNHQDDDQRECQ